MENTRGSEWNRWDLHLHTASSYDAKYKGNDADQLLCAALKEKHIKAVAITDHFVIDKDRIEHLRSIAPDIVFFPGVELRTDKNANNLHIILIFDCESRLSELSEDFNAIMYRQKAKAKEADETIYHELGHFLAFIAGNVDQSSAFASVYNSEKAKFTGYNKAYATQNAAEYFAESVKDYMLNGAALSSQRPNTYKAIQSALNTVTTARADAILKAYSSIWN